LELKEENKRLQDELLSIKSAYEQEIENWKSKLSEAPKTIELNKDKLSHPKAVVNNKLANPYWSNGKSSNGSSIYSV